MNDVFIKHPIVKESIKNEHLRFRGQSRPVMLMCETINACNNDCIVCAYSYMSRPKEIMSMSLFHKILDDYALMGGGGLSLTPVVGDLLLDPKLSDRVSVLKTYKTITPVSVSTNAIALEKYSDDSLYEIVNCFDRINVSVYGLDEIEYKTMTTRSFYRKAVSGINKILSLLEDKSRLVLSFRLLRNRDKQDVDAWIKNNIEFDVKTLSCITTYSNWGVIDDSVALPYDANWLKRREVTNSQQCLIPLVAMQVFSNGNVSFCPCDDFDNIDELHLGSVKNKSLLEIYNSEKVARLWDFNNNTPLFCKKCSFFIPMDMLNDFPSIFDTTTDFIGG